MYFTKHGKLSLMSFFSHASGYVRVVGGVRRLLHSYTHLSLQ